MRCLTIPNRCILQKDNCQVLADKLDDYAATSIFRVEWRSDRLYNGLVAKVQDGIIKSAIALMSSSILFMINFADRSDRVMQPPQKNVLLTNLRSPIMVPSVFLLNLSARTQH